MKMSRLSSEQEKRLIDYFRLNPSLWDTKDKDYNNRTIRSEKLELIAGQLGLNRKDVYEKYRNLRTTFFREHKRVTSSTNDNDETVHTPRWRHYHSMLFLISGTRNGNEQQILNGDTNRPGSSNSTVIDNARTQVILPSITLNDNTNSNNNNNTHTNKASIHQSGHANDVELLEQHQISVATVDIGACQRNPRLTSSASPHHQEEIILINSGQDTFTTLHNGAILTDTSGVVIPNNLLGQRFISNSVNSTIATTNVSTTSTTTARNISTAMPVCNFSVIHATSNLQSNNHQQQIPLNGNGHATIKIIDQQQAISTTTSGTGTATPLLIKSPIRFQLPVSQIAVTNNNNSNHQNQTNNNQNQQQQLQQSSEFIATIPTGTSGNSQSSISRIKSQSQLLTSTNIYGGTISSQPQFITIPTTTIHNQANVGGTQSKIAARKSVYVYQAAGQGASITNNNNSNTKDQASINSSNESIQRINSISTTTSSIANNNSNNTNNKNLHNSTSTFILSNGGPLAESTPIKNSNNSLSSSGNFSNSGKSISSTMPLTTTTKIMDYNEIENIINKLIQDKLKECDDEDMAFCRSLASSLRSLDRNKKEIVKYELQQVIVKHTNPNYFSNNNNNNSNSSNNSNPSSSSSSSTAATTTTDSGPQQKQQKTFGSPPSNGIYNHNHHHSSQPITVQTATNNVSTIMATGHASISTKAEPQTSPIKTSTNVVTMENTMTQIIATKSQNLNKTNDKNEIQHNSTISTDNLAGDENVSNVALDENDLQQQQQQQKELACHKMEIEE